MSNFPNNDPAKRTHSGQISKHELDGHSKVRFTYEGQPETPGLETCLAAFEKLQEQFRVI